MRTIETTARVSEDGTLTARVPPDVAPGDHHVVLVLEERAANGLTVSHGGTAGQTSASRESRHPEERKRQFIEEWPVHHVVDWPEKLSLRREDMYGDDGR
jgi:hypothetical protein